uniref:Acetaldehyde dehydrogenase n=1 Tax=Ectopseudomonas oleovorans TaxID=301 RepID=A0A653BCZ5_ECTOL
MPIAMIHIAAGRSEEKKHALLVNVTQSIAESLEVPVESVRAASGNPRNPVGPAARPLPNAGLTRPEHVERTTAMNTKISVAIIGSGNIGTDLMIKILRHGKHLRMGAMVGIDPASDGLARAERMGVVTTAGGIEGLLALPNFKDIRIVFDATSAGAHARHNELLQEHGVKVIDLTPAAIGPYTIPAINLDAELDAPNINMVTCGGQATIPIVAAVSRVTKVHYGEIVADHQQQVRRAWYPCQHR